MRADVIRTYARLRTEHPVIAHRESTDDPAPRAISQLVDRRSFASTRLYRELYRDLGILDQLLIPIPHPAAAVSVAIGRRSWGFSEHELALARVLQRILTVARRWQREREAVRVGIPLAGMLAGNDGRRILLSDRYGEVLRLDGAPADVDRRLQGAIRHAVDLACEAPAGGTPGRPLVEMTVPSADEKPVDVRVLGSAGESDLVPVVIEPPAPRPPERAAVRHPLTPRQADVMALGLRGRTNAAIANELGISPRTVAKHLEAAFRRLGVQTRTEAAVALLGREGGPARVADR